MVSDSRGMTFLAPDNDPVDAALARATAAVADRQAGWETTAAVLAAEVRRLREVHAEVSDLAHVWIGAAREVEKQAPDAAWVQEQCAKAILAELGRGKFT